MSTRACKMVIIRKIVKKHEESTRASRGSIKQKQQLKSNIEIERLNKKKTEQIKNATFKIAEVTKNLRNAKLKKNSVLNKINTTAKTKYELKKVSLNKFRKKNLSKSEKKAFDSTPEKHGDPNISGLEKENKVQKKQQENERSDTQKNTRISVRLLKRQHFVKENTEDAKMSHKILRKKRRIEIGESRENVNNFNSKDLSREHIFQCISAIFHLTQEQLKNKNTLFDGESHPVFMQVTSVRVPKAPQRQMRILLSHSIVSPDDEIALFVCDLQKGRKKDYEPTVEHYKDLLKRHGSTSVKTVIPMNQVKTEYDQYELKRKLVSSYDYFLVDGRIAGHMSHLLGKEFYRRRKLPISVRMQSNDLKHEIEYALKKTTMQMHSYGDTHTVQIGHTRMEQEEILENILETCNQLSHTYPGGWNNIRSIWIKTATSVALPIYTTLKSKNLVKVPSIHPRRPKAYNDITDELTTLSSNALVTVTPEGDVTVKRTSERKKKKAVQEFDA